jgi:hypothetical protein
MEKKGNTNMRRGAIVAFVVVAVALGLATLAIDIIGIVGIILIIPAFVLTLLYYIVMMGLDLGLTWNCYSSWTKWIGWSLIWPVQWISFAVYSKLPGEKTVA